MATAKKTAPKKKAAKKAVKKAAPRKAAGPRTKLDEAMKLIVKGEHNRREGSHYHEQYELMKKYGTVGGFLKGKGDREVLRAAIREGYAAVAA